MRVAIVNSSYYGMKPGDIIYTLAVEKIAQYHRLLGDEVTTGPWVPMFMQECDKFYFSAVFTWDIPELIHTVNLVKSWGKQVEVGGPAATFMASYIEAQIKGPVHRGLDDRFERVPGDYKVTFTSRGCPHKCPFCGVKKVEPVAIEYDDFPLAPMIGDNNILATSWEHQVMVVNKFAAWALIGTGADLQLNLSLYDQAYQLGLVARLDINSGFDVRFFEEKHLKLYSRLKLEYWRFAFDTLEVEADVRRVAGILKANGLDRHKVTFYVLFGFPGTTPQECLYRLNTIIELGMNPYPMRFWPLNSLNRKYIAPGWNEDMLYRMATYYQTPYIWKAVTWENFRPSKKAYEVHPDQSSSFIGGAV